MEAASRADFESRVAEDERRAGILFQHGSYQEPPDACFSTLNQLALGEKRLGEPRVHTYLWSGSKANDLGVPRSTAGDLSLTARKQRQWEEESGHDMYRTTSQTFQETVVGQHAKRETVKPRAEGGQPAQVGRKATGENVDWLENPMHKAYLRVPVVVEKDYQSA